MSDIASKVRELTDDLSHKQTERNTKTTRLREIDVEILKLDGEKKKIEMDLRTNRTAEDRIEREIKNFTEQLKILKDQEILRKKGRSSLN